MIAKWLKLFLILSICWTATATAAAAVASPICESKLVDHLLKPIDTFHFIVGREWNLPKGSLADDFRRLVYAGQLVDQDHSVLDHKGLLIAGGGLCNSSCAAALAIAHAMAYPLFAPSIHSHLDMIVEAVAAISLYTGRDARLGSNAVNGVRYLQGLVDSGTLPDSLQFKGKPFGPWDEADFFFSRGDVVLVSVMLAESYKTSPPVPIKGHALVLLGMDTEHKTVLAFDPNRPKDLLEMKYKESLSYHRGQGVYLYRDGEEYGKIEQSVKLRRIGLRRLPDEVQERLQR